MPCDTIQTTRITIDGMKDEQVATALEELGWKVERATIRTGTHTRTYSRGEGLRFYKDYQSGVFREGRLTVQDGVDQITEQALKQAYGRTVVKEQAKRAGWMLQQDKSNPNKMQMVRRY